MKPRFPQILIFFFAYPLSFPESSLVKFRAQSSERRWEEQRGREPKQERDPFTDLRHLLQSLDLTLTGMLSDLD